jgi:hypothetical protein
MSQNWVRMTFIRCNYQISKVQQQLLQVEIILEAKKVGRSKIIQLEFS